MTEQLVAGAHVNADNIEDVIRRVPGTHATDCASWRQNSDDWCDCIPARDPELIAAAIVTHLANQRSGPVPVTPATTVAATLRDAVKGAVRGLVCKEGMGNRVNEWFPDEADFYRNGEGWEPGHEGAWELRLDKVAAAVIDKLGLVDVTKNELTVVLSPSELLAIAADLQQDQREKRGPRLTGANRLITQAHAVADSWETDDER